MSSSERALRGITCVVAATACFATLDTGTKFISAGVPLVMVLWARYVFQAVFMLAVVLPRTGRALAISERPGLQVLRGLLLMLCSTLAILSLMRIPVGEFTAIVMITPLLLTLLSAKLLKERVSALRWLLVVGGFVGAIMVIRPGTDAFDWAMLLPLVLVLANAGFLLVTSALSKYDNASTTHFYTGAVGLALSTLALPLFWKVLEPSDLWLGLAGLGALSTLGHYLLIVGYSSAPAGALTPYLYFQISFATLAGWLVFSHAPDRWTLAGICVITVSGVIGTWLTARERRSRAASAPA